MPVLIAWMIYSTKCQGRVGDPILAVLAKDLIPCPGGAWDQEDS
jgi:hypothetical protein